MCRAARLMPPTDTPGRQTLRPHGLDAMLRRLSLPALPGLAGRSQGLSDRCHLMGAVAVDRLLTSPACLHRELPLSLRYTARFNDAVLPFRQRVPRAPPAGIASSGRASLSIRLGPFFLTFTFLLTGCSSQ